MAPEEKEKEKARLQKVVKVLALWGFYQGLRNGVPAGRTNFFLDGRPRTLTPNSP